MAVETWAARATSLMVGGMANGSVGEGMCGQESQEFSVLILSKIKLTCVLVCNNLFSSKALQWHFERFFMSWTLSLCAVYCD